MHTATNSDSGPSGRGLASVLWPGDLAGSAPPSLAYEQLLAPIFDSIIDESPGPLADGLRTIRDEVGGFLSEAPSYPIKAESHHPQGPSSAETQMGAGLGMRSQAKDGLSEAVANGSNAGFPGVFFAGDLNSTSFSGIRNGISHSEAESIMKNVSLFGGILTVDTFRNKMVATSDGLKATLDGTIVLGGLVLTYPDGSGGNVRVEILSLDERGVVVNDRGRMNWDQARAFFAEELSPHGITIRLLEDEQTLAGAAAKRAMSGLEIRFDGRALAALRDTLPDPVREWISSPGESPLGPIYQGLPPTLAGLTDSLVQFDQSMTVVLGNVRVNGAASPPFNFGIPLPPGVDPPLIPPPISVGGPVFPPPGPGDTIPGAPGTSAFGGSPVAVGVAGLPAALVTLAMMLALAGAVGLRALADRATRAAIAAGADCSL